MNIQQTTKPLFIFEMANNHSGKVEHGITILKEIDKVVNQFRDTFDFGFKLQYRDLDSLIHPDFKQRMDLKYIKRFSETKLQMEEFTILKAEIVNLGFLAICTPFDEKSVDSIESHNYDVIKIASCSINDWPLLERIVQSEKSVIASTAGVELEVLDKVVSFFQHRNKDFSLMHCVGEYPTANGNLNLNQIDLLKNRYPGIKIGYSTHEQPDSTIPIAMAIAKGATIFEKHVGVPTESIGLNDYSASPMQVLSWLTAARSAYEISGVSDHRHTFGTSEISSLLSLRRGVFANRDLKQGEKIDRADLLIAVPTSENQITANDLSKYTHFYAETDILANKPLLTSNVKKVETRNRIYQIMEQLKAILRESRVVVPHQLDFEISHHYGIDRFEEVGATIISYLNREYCKKLIIVLPGQIHPEQYHQLKEETFIVQYGEMELVLDDVARICRPGDIITVERGVRHKFSSQTGAVIEEISSTHYRDDSYYTDPAIADNHFRKTLLTYWID
jgi:sialic acid synthase SpsE/mannose-6-phosphate isomerase-like protein (cupin superfamily)